MIYKIYLDDSYVTLDVDKPLEASHPLIQEALLLLNEVAEELALEKESKPGLQAHFKSGASEKVSNGS